ncbi:MAG: nucleotidyltransferase domain-containing protein [Methanocellales archaeon]|nr:nucleotidyltransferase domain-containing protein [Methanocellales archaeon]
MQKIKGFLREFGRRAAEYDAVESAVLFGSAANGTWHPGSDLDIVVVLSHNDDKVKKELVDLFWELDKKYGTGIIDAHAMHPPIIFLDRKWKKRIFAKALSSYRFLRLFQAFDRVQKRLKRFAPRYRFFYG